MSKKPTKNTKARGAAEPKAKQTKEKKEKPVRPTVVLKHAKVLKDLSVNVRSGKKRSLKEAAMKNGYSESYADTGRMTKTKSWKQMLDHYLPESDLLEAHKEQLRSFRVGQMTFSKQVSEEDIYDYFESINRQIKKIIELPTGLLVLYWDVDNQSKNKAIEMGLKLHKKLTDKVEVKDTTPFTQLSDAELAERISKAKKFFTKK